MNRLLLKLALAATVGSLLCSNLSVAQVLPPAAKAAHVKITQGPALEFARGDLAIIRWTTNNPGGSDDHFGVVYYGTAPKDLEPDGEVAHQAQPGPSTNDVSCAHGRPASADDLLLHGDLDGQQR